MCANTRHAETEHGQRDGEFEALPLIEPIDDLVGNSTDQVDEDKDGAYGYVLVDIGNATDHCDAGRKVWRLRLQCGQSQSLVGNGELLLPYHRLDVLGAWLSLLWIYCLVEVMVIVMALFREWCV